MINQSTSSTFSATTCIIRLLPHSLLIGFDSVVTDTTILLNQYRLPIYEYTELVCGITAEGMASIFSNFDRSVGPAGSLTVIFVPSIEYKRNFDIKSNTWVTVTGSKIDQSTYKSGLTSIIDMHGFYEKKGNIEEFLRNSPGL